MEHLQEFQEFKFFVNNEEHKVKVSEIDREMTLNEYLRDVLNQKGTKKMCLEGGCGSCIVAITIWDRIAKKHVTYAANSCLVPVFICEDWHIETTEKIGNRIDGYHAIQETLVKFNGTQCGFCSPGMIMNMYAMSKSGNVTMKDVENGFGGNICRCTGYRPILTAFKSLAVDASDKLLGKYPDMEDMMECKKGKEKCQLPCLNGCEKATPRVYNFGETLWFKAFTINDIITIIKTHPKSNCMLIRGNTATGVYKRTETPDIYIDLNSVYELMSYKLEEDTLTLGANITLTKIITVCGVYKRTEIPDIYIDLNSVDELMSYKLEEDTLTLGANITLTKIITVFYNLAKANPNFSYLEKMADHIDLIANVPVRNIGTLAGNVMIKYYHREFPSDIYLLFETIGAKMKIVDIEKNETTVDMINFLKTDMKNKIIKSFILPALDSSYKFESYKVMPRAQNSHAIVNAGFLLKLDAKNVVLDARIIYGGISPDFIHATNAEKCIVGKHVFDSSEMQELFKSLHESIVPDHVLPDSDPTFRRNLAISLCYKYLLTIAPDNLVSAQNKSGRLRLEKTREISKGCQDYDTNVSLYPLTQPIPKIEALVQCSGEAEYIMDRPELPNQLYAAFVMAKAAPNSVIIKIDNEEALRLPGVVAYFDKGDIPGENTFTPTGTNLMMEEELFCKGVVKFYFQPVGVIVAESQKIAEAGANLVKITYTPSSKKPLLTVREILKARELDKITFDHKISPTRKGDESKHTYTGKFDIYSQSHYYMETQSCVAVPTEDGIDVFPTTQCMDYVQIGVAAVLKITVNRVNITVRRLGGAYGGKLSRNGIVSCAAALAAYKLGKPVKFWLPMIDNNNIMGKRYGFTADYKVSVNNAGVIQYLYTDVYCDYGNVGPNENINSLITDIMQSMYDTSTWEIQSYTAKTDVPQGTWCRAPGTTEGHAFVESVMNHIAAELNTSPYLVRLGNLDSSKGDVGKYLDTLIEWCEYVNRKKEIENFNKSNRWIKKGIFVVPMTYPIIYPGGVGSIVSIYQGDGSVVIGHGGIEMGQGINTKVVQVCAHALGIPLDKISIKPTTSIWSPNAFSSAASITSETVCYAVLQCCDTLKARMDPIREILKDPSWEELVKKCYFANVDLTAYFRFNPKLPDVQTYKVYGATCAEVEVDILTGTHQVTRVDLLEDVGDSMSPLIDIGQVEGAFVMGLGYWTSEKLVFSPEGELLTNRTWNYKVPGPKDIPVNFNVKFPKNNPNPYSILHSKATAEPSFTMSCSIPFAIMDAVNSVRSKVDDKAALWYCVDGPFTVEIIYQQCLHDYTQYQLDI